MRTSRWLLALVLTAVALGAAAWLIASIGEMHDRLARHSGTLALVFLGHRRAVAVASALAAARLFWKLGRPELPPARPPEDVIRAAEVQAEKAEGVIAQVKDESARAGPQRRAGRRCAPTASGGGSTSSSSAPARRARPR